MGAARSKSVLVSIAGAILFWGLLGGRLRYEYQQLVSIAGAILFWGLPRQPVLSVTKVDSFNRRGDSFLGATSCCPDSALKNVRFQSQGRFFFGGYSDGLVGCSIPRLFQSQGRFFFGGYEMAGESDLLPDSFQSQGRFFFGGYPTEKHMPRLGVGVSIAGAILFWGLPTIGTSSGV